MPTYPAISAGQRITGSLLTSMLPITVVKPGSTQRASNTTLADDPDLTLPLVASATYLWEAYIAYSVNVAAGSADLKSTFTVPAGATLVGTQFGTATASTPTSYDVTVGPGSWPRSMAGNGSVGMAFRPSGSIVMGGTAGNVTLQWAQNTSSVTPLFVLAGSWMKLTRVS